MYRFLLATTFYLLSAVAAAAGCSVGALPFLLQNNTTADATQVMADFNQIVNGVNSNCASAGSNNDITSLSALSTPLSVAQGGSPVFIGGFTTGTANVQSITVPSSFALTTGYHVTGFWGATNTGAMTLSVNAGTAVPVWRKTQNGTSSTAGGEAIVGHPFDLIYNGTNFVNISETIYVAEYKRIAYLGGAPPPGWLIADGSSFACATYQDLCTAIGTTYGGTAMNPLLPDTRGRVLTGLDNYGTSAGAASRLTSVATGCGVAFTAVGAACSTGNQSHTQIVAELATHNHTDSGHTHTVTDPGHTHNAASGSFVETGSSTPFASSTGGGASSATTASATTGITNQTGFASITNTGSSQAMPIVNPNLGVVTIIRF